MLYNKILSLFHLIIASNNITPKTDLSSFGNGNELLSIVFWSQILSYTQK